MTKPEWNIISFAPYSSFLNRLCAEFIKEESTNIFNKEHKLVKKAYEIKNTEGNNTDFSACIFNYKTLKDFLNLIE